MATSHGPFRESYTIIAKANGEAAEAPSTTAATAALSAQGMRAAFSSATSASAVLQRWLPGKGAEVVAVEGAATLSGNHGWPSPTQRPKPALPGARQEPETATVRGS